MKRSLPQFLAGLVLAGLFGSLGLPSGAAPGSWEDRFQDPPADARILKIIHSWPDADAAQDALIRRLQGQGFGGVVCNVSFDQYLRSDAKWQAFARAVREARRAGFALWLYDERGYPSGNAGGLTLEGHPEWEARGLLAVEAVVADGAATTLEVPPGTLVLARACRMRDGAIQAEGAVDLAARVSGGKLEWRAPEGRWKVVVLTESRLFEGTHADGNLHEKIPYPNLLLEEPTRRFLDLTYGGYVRHLGDDLGRTFEATFTDEPSLMSLFVRPMPWRPLPWAATLPEEFRRRRGYALDASLLPALVADAGPGTARVRHDFWRTVAELVSRNYFGQIRDRCRRHGVPSGGHLLAEEGLAGHVPLYGDFFRCIRQLDAPSIDCLTSVPAEVPWFIARLLASAAELEGRTLVMSETSDHAQVYRPAGDTRPRRTVTEAEIRGTANRLVASGVNVLTSYYSFTDLSDDALRRLNAWVGRVCTAMRGGHQVADLAVVYPIESVWTRFVPSRHWTREASAAARIENLYRTAAEGLHAANRGFTFIDAQALADSRVEAGALVHGRARWRVVILPGVDTLPLAAWERLAAFVRDGGVAIALGELPCHSESEFPSARVKDLAREMFGITHAAAASMQSRFHPRGGGGVFLPAGAAGLLPGIVAGLLEPEVTVDGARPPIRSTHRRIEDRDVYFLINDGPEPWSGTVRLAGDGPGERWNPATGRRDGPVPGGGEFRLELGPYDATVVRFASVRPSRRLDGTGASLPVPRLDPIPAAPPAMIRGEFVRAEVVPDAARSGEGPPAWRVEGTLTRGQVDTFLFADFRLAPGFDWTGVDHLELETWVPEGQSTPNQLLVILQEEGGGDFLVETGRSLAGPGQERTFLPLDRFQLAGWSRDADGRLDARRIGAVRVGWGGYLGEAGERVAFTVRLPRVGRVGGEARHP